MPAPPSVAPFAGLLADLARDLRRGSCCLVVCDKGWTLPICAAIRDRLRPVPPEYERAVAFRYLDWRPPGRHPDPIGNRPLTELAVRNLRDAVRSTLSDEGHFLPAEDRVFALPHLDILTAVEGGWTAESREVIALLYENPTMVWLGFQDPSVTLPPLVEKVFTRRYVLASPCRTLDTLIWLPEEPRDEPPAPPPADPILDEPAAGAPANPISGPPSEGDEATPEPLGTPDAANGGEGGDASPFDAPVGEGDAAGAPGPAGAPRAEPTTSSPTDPG